MKHTKFCYRTARAQVVHTRNSLSAQIVSYDYLNKCNNDSSQPEVTYPNSFSIKVDIGFFWAITKARKRSCQGFLLFNTCLHTPLYIE